MYILSKHQIYGRYGNEGTYSDNEAKLQSLWRQISLPASFINVDDFLPLLSLNSSIIDDFQMKFVAALEMLLGNLA